MEINGKTYEIDEHGIQSPTIHISSKTLSDPVSSRPYVDDCKKHGIDPGTVRIYHSPDVDGKYHSGPVYVQAPAALEYDKFISASIEAGRIKRENSIVVYLSSRGWGDYSPVEITIDRRDGPPVWLKAAKDAFLGKDDVDRPGQPDDELMGRIMKEVAKFDKKASDKAEREKHISDCKLRAAETGERQFVRKYMDDCDDDKEECSLDVVSVYAMPDGSLKDFRSHTW